MTDGQDKDNEAVVLDTTLQTIVANAVAPEFAAVATQSLSLRARIGAWGDPFITEKGDDSLLDGAVEAFEFLRGGRVEFNRPS